MISFPAIFRIAVCLVLFVDAIGGSLILPILPELFLNKEIGLLVGNEYLSSEWLYSISLALFPFTSIFGMVILGAISDKSGRKGVIIWGAFGLTICYLLSAIAITIHSIWLFLLTRALGGFLSGTYSAGNALISDISRTEQERVSNFKLPTIASVLGFVMGPSLTIFVIPVYYCNPLALPFLIAFILGILNWILLKYNLNNIEKKNSKNIVQFLNKKAVRYPDMHKRKPDNLPTELKSLIFDKPRIKFFIIAYMLFQLALGLLFQSLSFHLSVMYHYTPKQIGLFYTIMAITMVISMYTLQQADSKYINFDSQIKWGLITLSITITLIFCFNMLCGNNEYVVWTMGLGLYIFTPIIGLSFSNLFIKNTEQKSHGKIMGISGQISSISLFVSAIFMSNLIVNYNLLLIITGVLLALSYVVLKHSSSKSLSTG